MLWFTPTPNHAGVVLWADTWSFRRIIDLVHKVTRNNPVIPDEETFLLGLAYDARHAADGSMKQDVVAQRYPGGDVNIFGVQILWPEIIVQLGLLRYAMAFTTPTRSDQAIMFELEAAIESALQEVCPAQSVALMAQMATVGTYPHDNLSELLESRCRYFIEQTPSLRISVLSAILLSFNPMYAMTNNSAPDGSGRISADIWAHYEDDDSELPDFEW